MSPNFIEVGSWLPVTSPNFDLENYNQAVDLMLGKYNYLFNSQ